MNIFVLPRARLDRFGCATRYIANRGQIWDGRTRNTTNLRNSTNGPTSSRDFNATMKARFISHHLIDEHSDKVSARAQTVSVKRKLLFPSIPATKSAKSSTWSERNLYILSVGQCAPAGANSRVGTTQDNRNRKQSLPRGENGGGCGLLLRLAFPSV